MLILVSQDIGLSVNWSSAWTVSCFLRTGLLKHWYSLILVLCIYNVRHNANNTNMNYIYFRRFSTHICAWTSTSLKTLIAPGISCRYTLKKTIAQEVKLICCMARKGLSLSLAFPPSCIKLTRRTHLICLHFQSPNWCKNLKNICIVYQTLALP